MTKTMGPNRKRNELCDRWQLMVQELGQFPRTADLNPIQQFWLQPNGLVANGKARAGKEVVRIAVQREAGVDAELKVFVVRYINTPSR